MSAGTTDARIKTAFPQHPKTKKIIRKLSHKGAWGVLCLFLWAAQNKPTGDLVGMTDEDVEIAADWEGENGLFVAALRDVRFLDGSEGRYTIHDWEDHNPWAFGAQDRSHRAKFGQLVRDLGTREKAVEAMRVISNRYVEDHLIATTRPSPSPSPIPSVSLPSPSPSRKASSQEEISNSTVRVGGLDS